MIKQNKAAGLFSKVANIASFLCLIHCLLSSLFAVLAPKFLTYLPHNYWVEGSIWVIASASALWMLNRTTCSKPFYVFLGILFFFGTYFVITHNHNYFVVSLLLLAILQMSLTIQHHWRDHRDGKCHDHLHHHAGHCEDEAIK